jgi:hypothetical protein
LITQSVALNLRKLELTLAMVNVFEQPIIPFLRSKNCGNALLVVQEYWNGLISNGIWPITESCQTRSLAELLARCSALEEPEGEPFLDTCTVHCELCRNSNWTSVVLEGTDKLCLMKNGLCLDCVKTGGRSGLDKICRQCVPKL